MNWQRCYESVFLYLFPFTHFTYSATSPQIVNSSISLFHVLLSSSSLSLLRERATVVSVKLCKIKLMSGWHILSAGCWYETTVRDLFFLPLTSLNITSVLHILCGKITTETVAAAVWTQPPSVSVPRCYFYASFYPVNMGVCLFSSS